uniref:RRM domain-containing protein n=1 Tax=Chlamydomonas leiostraca TaxID=1034604 RepID=A0A7S0R583_9CHLO|mmetsp:Transcript_14165/g.34940  ORF Transcript_14165/g.34940 Transcript_14165/m.34940 type:complete len:552 (+) Transcript_14165:118-1773(+)
MMPGAVQQPSQQNSWRAAEQTPVCPEPKVFAGQIPFESTTQDVQNLFAQYGNIRSCQVITGPDGRSKGCAMILYSTWTEAELAVENENGTQHLGGQKPMVVKFADPPKRGDGPIVGIAAKKLFVGQIPPNMTEEALRAMFQPYGNITEVHLLKKNPGSGCAFVCYDRWSACEAAVAALHGKHQLEGAKMPIVVKFADAKVDGFAGSKRGFESMAPNGQHAMFNNGGMPGNMGGGANGKKAFTSMGQGQGFNPYGMGMGYGMGGPMGQMGYGMGQMGMMGMGMQGMGMGMQGMNMGGMGGMGMGTMGGMGMMGGMPTLEPGRVILALPDMSTVDFFRQQFASLPAPFEVYPGVGPDMAVQLAQQGLNLGGTSFVDFVLLAPDFLHNRSPVGLVGRLKSMGMRVCAYGWQPAGPMRELVESAGLDGWISGPVPPQGLNRMEFVQLIARMQTLKKGGAAPGMMGGMGMASPRTTMTPPAGPGMSGMIPGAMSAGGAANPLFNSPPSPLASQPGMMGGAPMGAAPGTGGVNAESEAAMMQQLMAEINQLRAELNN